MIKVHWVDINVSQEITKSQRRQLLLERAVIICMLDPDTIYTPSAVAATAYPLGSRDYESAKRAFGGFSRRNGIGLDFDNVEKKDSEDCGWCGSTWVLKLPAVSRNKVAVVMDELRRLSEQQPGQYYIVNNELVHERELTNIKPQEASVPDRVVSGREVLHGDIVDLGETRCFTDRPGPLARYTSILPSDTVIVNHRGKSKSKLSVRNVFGVLAFLLVASTAVYTLHRFFDTQVGAGVTAQDKVLKD